MAQVEHYGHRFADVRKWLDISHRALGRLAIEHGVQMHESLWASWEQRPQFPASAKDTVLAIVKIISERLEGEPSKNVETIMAHLEGSKSLPKKPPVWKEGMKPFLKRGRRPGPQKPELRVVEGENRVDAIPGEMVALATDVIVEAMNEGSTPLSEKVKALLKMILQSNAKRALPLLVLFWLSLLPSQVQASPASTPRGYWNLLKFPRRKKKRA